MRIPIGAVREDDHMSDLDAETQRLEKELHVAKLTAAIASLAIPWWRRGSVVSALLTGMTTIVGAAVAAVTAINGHYQLQKELELKTAEQKHEAELSSQKLNEEIRSRYLDRMKDESERQRTLRFLIATASDDRVQTWASEEKKVVDEEIAALKGNISDLEHKKQALKEEMTVAIARKNADLSSFRRRASDLETEKRSLEERLRSSPTPFSPNDISMVTR